ncbi:MAG: hypothetical protein JW394_0971 [Nitrospira sp.]|nr:hypothetical protein [Nitrospira sp.]
MALIPGDKARLTRSALATISQRGRLMSERALTLRLMAQSPGLPGGSYQAYQAVARQTRLLYQAGRRLQKTTIARPTGRELPIDPSLDQHDARYQYRVIVSGRTPAGVRVSTAVNVQSDTALSRVNVDAQARQMFEQSDTPYRENRAAIRSVPKGSPLEFQIVSAGRRG